ncbi:general stress protein [Lacipirellula sp.]|uniref:general stress protein n=1 Tax=Lacipirellula sp. TaxID=2691419 RepID=UPI003D13967D
MAKAVFCTVKTSDQATRVVDQLKVAGFTSDDISVLMPDKSGTKEFAVDNKTKAPEGAATGAGTGAVLGGGLGWLAGIGALAIPGLGPLIAAGPIMAALTGAAVGGTIGGLTGALIGMGIPEYEAKRYEGKVKGGNALISVHSEDSTETERAKKIFEAAGAEDIATSGEASTGAKR